MKSNKQELEKKLIEKKDEIGLVRTNLYLDEIPGNYLKASIDTGWSKIEIGFGKDLNLVPDELTEKFVERVNISDPELKTGEDLVHHETGHRENPAETTLGYPFTIQIHDSIKESIYKGLSEKGKQSLTNYMANAFEDIFDNSNCKNQTDFYGQTLFWNNEGLVKSSEQKFSPFYEAFVKINLMLGGDIISYNFLKRLFKNEEKTKKAQDNFLKDLKNKFGLEHFVNFNKSLGFEKVFDKDLEKREKTGSELAYLFAKHMADLLDKVPQERLFGSVSDENSEEYNPFDRMMKDPNVIQKIAYSRYKQGKGPALHRDKKEQLFDLYRAISKEISVKTTEFSTSETMPLIHYGKRPFTEEDSRLRFRGMGIDEKGNFFIKTTKYVIEEPASYKTHPINFPKLKICLMDRSGSMAYNSKNETNLNYEPKNVGNKKFIPWGDKSKYHFALKGRFGIDNFLERQGIAPYVQDIALGWSGEAPVKGNYKEVAKSLLEFPKGGTGFDINNLEKILDKKALVLSLSDAEFSLSEDIKIRLKEKLKLCDMAHIQIGYGKDSQGKISKNDYCQFLELNGIPVFYVQGDNDLSQIMMNFVSGYYKSLNGGDKN